MTYAIRFKGGNGDKYRAAYRYEALINAGAGNNDLFDHVTVTVRELGPSRTGVTLDDISNEAYWNSAPDLNQCQVVRYIPKGHYWSSTEEGNHRQNVASCQMQSARNRLPNFEDAFFCDDRIEHSIPWAESGTEFQTHYVFPITRQR